MKKNKRKKDKKVSEKKMLFRTFYKKIKGIGSLPQGFT